MTDNPKYCVFARFCHPGGDAWTLTERSADPEARQLAIREASMCPGGRLTAWDRKTGSPYEFRFAPSLGLIEDVTIGSSGGLWIRGGIPLRREDGHTYEIRTNLYSSGRNIQNNHIIAIILRTFCRIYSIIPIF